MRCNVCIVFRAKGQFEWRTHVATKIKESVDGVLSAGVYCQPACEVYKAGAYADARKG